MSETKWTPGPWRLDDRAEAHVIAENRPICSVSFHNNLKPEETRIENLACAHLIAAAPELAEGVAWLLRELPTNRDWMDPDLERFLNHALTKALGINND